MVERHAFVLLSIVGTLSGSSEEHAVTRTTGKPVISDSLITCDISINVNHPIHVPVSAYYHLWVCILLENVNVILALPGDY